MRAVPSINLSTKFFLYGQWFHWLDWKKKSENINLIKWNYRSLKHISKTYYTDIIRLTACVSFEPEKSITKCHSIIYSSSFYHAKLSMSRLYYSEGLRSCSTLAGQPTTKRFTSTISYVLSRQVKHSGGVFCFFKKNIVIFRSGLTWTCVRVLEIEHAACMALWKFSSVVTINR